MSNTNDQNDKVRVAVVQASPVLFDRDATVEKAGGLAQEAAAGGAQLIVFPEAFIPAYPRGLSFGNVVGGRTPEGRRLWQSYWEASVEVPSPTTDALGRMAREAGAYVAMGVVERDSQFSRGTLYCTLLYFGPDGSLLGKHRKLKPTAAERLIWGEGDGSTLTVLDTRLGRLGGLICWENYMPLARMALYGKGVEIYLAPTADARDSWQATLRHIACEGRCFVLGCNQFTTRDMYPASLRETDELMRQPEIMCTHDLRLAHQLVRFAQTRRVHIARRELIAAQHKAAPFAGDVSQRRLPGIASVGGRRQINLHTLAVQRHARQRHVVLPADQPAQPAQPRVQHRQGAAVPFAPDQALGGSGLEFAMLAQ
jgi:nitrilase